MYDLHRGATQRGLHCAHERGGQLTPRPRISAQIHWSRAANPRGERLAEALKAERGPRQVSPRPPVGEPCDFALVAMLGLLGLRIFEATSADTADLGEAHGHRVLRVCGKGTKIVLVPLPPAVGRAIDRAVSYRVRGPILLNTRGARMDRHAACAASPKPPASRSPGHTRISSVTRSSRPCSTVALTCACRSPPGTPTGAPRCAITGPPEPGPPSELHPGRLHASGT